MLCLLDSYCAPRSKLQQAEETATLETDGDDDTGRSQRKKWRAWSLTPTSSPEKHKRTQKSVSGKRALLPLPQPPAPLSIGTEHDSYFSLLCLQQYTHTHV